MWERKDSAMKTEKNFNCYFHHASILVDDYDAAIAFYDAIGFHRYFEWEENGQRKCFLDIGAGPLLEMTQGVSEKDPVHSRLQHYCLYVDSVDGFYEQALAAGAKSLVKPDPYPIHCTDGTVINSRACVVLAPGGEIIEVIHWKGYDPNNYENYVK